jgi:hypothetical protein
LRMSFSSAHVIIELIKDSALGCFSTFQVQTHFSESGLCLQLAHAY